MFTGIIEEIGIVEKNKSGQLIIQCSKILSDAQLGDSIAINGVDLTISKIFPNSLGFDIMPETFRKSNLVNSIEKSKVNLERSLTLQTKLSGHIVRGVIETTCNLFSMDKEDNAIIATYQVSPQYLNYILKKGPVAIDGVSLTVISKNKDSFSVSLVEWTQKNTNLLERKIGALINLETDILARYVEQLIDRD
ncbi:MAG: riboflavin synthase [Dehalococcoidia bacterium]|jgi:riboflavin synthase|nr:MAG: riboflavin synthase [Chloroflexota bacterium]